LFLAPEKDANQCSTSATGLWLADNWLQALSGVIIVLTFLAQLYFGMRKDRRELRQSQREAERHARENPTSQQQEP
jgi:hypothetical protein